jgi:polar amino acid transport system substrate-binding protein
MLLGSYNNTLFASSTERTGHSIVQTQNIATIQSSTESKGNLPESSANHYNFASIELLIEQEVGRIVLTQIYKNIGINITISPLPGKRAQYVANSGIKDGEIMRIWTYGDENANTIRVPTSYYYLETMPFVLKNSDISILKKQDLAKYRLTKIRGVKHTNNITQGLQNIYEMSSTEDMFKLLLSGKVDVVLTNTSDGNLALERLGLTNVVSMKKPLIRLPLYHYIHKNNKNLVQLVDKEILRMKGNGELSSLIQQAEKIIVQLNQYVRYPLSLSVE